MNRWEEAFSTRFLPEFNLHPRVLIEKAHISLKTELMSIVVFSSCRIILLQEVTKERQQRVIMGIEALLIINN